MRLAGIGHPWKSAATLALVCLAGCGPDHADLPATPTAVALEAPATAAAPGTVTLSATVSFGGGLAPGYDRVEFHQGGSPVGQDDRGEPVPSPTGARLRFEHAVALGASEAGATRTYRAVVVWGASRLESEPVSVAITAAE